MPEKRSGQLAAGKEQSDEARAARERRRRRGAGESWQGAAGSWQSAKSRATTREPRESGRGEEAMGRAGRGQRAIWQFGDLAIWQFGEALMANRNEEWFGGTAVRRFEGSTVLPNSRTQISAEPPNALRFALSACPQRGRSEISPLLSA